jgi:hypothetical protein
MQQTRPLLKPRPLRIKQLKKPLQPPPKPKQMPQPLKQQQMPPPRPKRMPPRNLLET